MRGAAHGTPTSTGPTEEERSCRGRIAAPSGPGAGARLPPELLEHVGPRVEPRLALDGARRALRRLTR
ncbi:MAG TPA: hypothetical protein VFB42_12535 [Gaiellaceae bacterium]|nr:hypothetical protein [Gaiellaceae bacterium]